MSSFDDQHIRLARRIEELEADNARLRDLIRDIDKATIWESGGTVPDRSMQGRIDAALDVMGKENSTVEKGHDAQLAPQQPRPGGRRVLPGSAT